MSGITKLMTAGGGGVALTPASSIASDVTVQIPSVNCTLNALVQGTAQASTSGTSIDFTGIPSWVKRITVMFNGVSTNGTSDIMVQIGSGSVTTSGYKNVRSQTSGGSAQLATTYTNGFHYTNVALSVLDGPLILSLQNSNYWVGQSVMADSGNNYIIFSAGGVSLSGALDRVRITTANGTDTFDAGSINILYE